MAGKPGYLGEVRFGAVTVNEMMNWNYAGATMDQLDDSYLGVEDKSFIQGQSDGGEITMSGNFLLNSDPGQQLLKTYYDARTQFTDIRLYINKVSGLYYELDDTTSATRKASYATITKYNEVSVDKTGLVTVSVTVQVSGRLKLSSTTSEPAVVTYGASVYADVTATFVGELTGLGEESTMDCYFEWGTTSSFGTDSSVSAVTKTAVGLYENDITGLSALTTYYFRAVAEKTDTSKVYGETKSFTTTS